jgi:hypothetical protein
LYFFTINACRDTGPGTGAGELLGVVAGEVGVLSAGVLGAGVETGGADGLGAVLVEDVQAAVAVRPRAASPIHSFMDPWCQRPADQALIQARLAVVSVVGWYSQATTPG